MPLRVPTPEGSVHMIIVCAVAGAWIAAEHTSPPIYTTFSALAHRALTVTKAEPTPNAAP